MCRGAWHTEQGDLDIAVKMLNSQSTEKDRVRFLREAAIVGQFKHPNIVRLHGVVTVGEPVSPVWSARLINICIKLGCKVEIGHSSFLAGYDSARIGSKW